MVHHVINRPGILLFIDIKVEDVFAHIKFVGNLHHLILTIFKEDDNIVHIRTITNELTVFFQVISNKTLFFVHIQFFVCFHHFSGINGIEVPNFRKTLAPLTVLRLQVLEPCDGVGNDVIEIVLNFSHLVLQSGKFLLTLKSIEFMDSRHFDFLQTEQVFTGHLPQECRFERFETFINVFQRRLKVFCVFVFLILINTFLNKDFFQRAVEKGFPGFAQLYF